MLSFIAGIGLIIGFGYVLEYLSFTAEMKSKGQKIVMHVVRKGAHPVATEIVTDPLGGFFYMLLDRRVTQAILTAIPLSSFDTHSSPKSPKDIRREHHTPI
jgi:hypothetical protein